MAPFVVQIVVWLALRAAGASGVDALDSWIASLRFSMATLFAFTGVAHFVPSTRADMVRMVPPRLPRPEMLVALTGVLELAGAAGLVIAPLVRAAAWGLAAMLVAMFPANIHAARENLVVAGSRVPPLSVRLPMQVFWVGCLVAVALSAAGH